MTVLDITLGPLLPEHPWELAIAIGVMAAPLALIAYVVVACCRRARRQSTRLEPTSRRA